MTVTDFLFSLTAATISNGAAILIVLALRRPLRRAFDAGVAYLIWTLVPLAMLAVLVPASMPSAVLRTLVVPGTSVIAALGVHLRDASLPYAIPALLALWAIGVAMAMLLFVRHQFRFERALGCLQALDDGTYVAQTCIGLPAVIGILRPRIVLPADHARRFDAGQRVLVREHEHVHIARGDQLVNLLALALRCLFWFNPLLYWAAPRFRHDQELACDARVIARHPQARRTYGEALLSTYVTLVAAPLSCQIGFGHPLKERIAMLKQPSLSFPRRVVGTASVLVLVAGAACAANVARTASVTPDTPAQIQAPQKTDYPAEAKARGVTGIVYLKVHVTAAGNVDKVEVERAEPAGVFDASAIEIARKMKIKPAMKNGKPVPTELVIPVKFALHDQDASSPL